ncbi:MAG TPA: hypothetical protein PK504_13185 [Ferruginibacter sp.]|nr:hypothetical protein [Ferruginibacter sp.]HRE62447.1 hypothetical protein [Ferruginibacter sp.]
MYNPYTQSTKISLGWLGRCGCMLQVKLMSHLEFVMVMIQPVT